MSLNEAYTRGSNSPPQKKICISAISTDFSELLKNLSFFEKESVASLHIDIMDGHFVPRLGMYSELISEIARKTTIPIDIHLMVTNPFDYISEFAKLGVAQIIPHIESTPHIHRLLSQILMSKVKAGIAINPGTSIHNLEDLFSIVSSVLVMGINPGIKGHTLIESTPARVKAIRVLANNLDFKGTIDVDGGITFENLMTLCDAGANRFVCGAGTVFKSETSIETNLHKLLDLLS